MSCTWLNCGWYFNSGCMQLVVQPAYLSEKSKERQLSHLCNCSVDLSKDRKVSVSRKKEKCLKLWITANASIRNHCYSTDEHERFLISYLFLRGSELKSSCQVFLLLSSLKECSKWIKKVVHAAIDLDPLNFEYLECVSGVAQPRPHRILKFLDL